MAALHAHENPAICLTTQYGGIPASIHANNPFENLGRDTVWSLFLVQYLSFFILAWRAIIPGATMVGVDYFDA